MSLYEKKSASRDQPLIQEKGKNDADLKEKGARSIQAVKSKRVKKQRPQDCDSLPISSN
jgi:hypothetical protein